MENKGHNKDNRNTRSTEVSSRNSDFVLEKVIFSNVFEKDIRRIYIYKKSERLAKAIQLITPAFTSNPPLRNRLDAISVGLIDAAILPPLSSREALSRELLALSSLLAVARTTALLSDMNADLITREALLLLQEIAGYEEPLLSLEEVPSLAEFARQASRSENRQPGTLAFSASLYGGVEAKPVLKDMFPSSNKGHLSDNLKQSSRQEAILAVLSSRGPSYIKDISTVIKDVSEKTIQRELQALVVAGKVSRSGERRWTQYQAA